MGALHEGHLSLVRKSRKENPVTVVSIFVNPKQFGPGEDYAKYPRETKKDKILLKSENVDIIIYPSVEEMYPRGYLTHVEVNGMDNHLCGRSRPGHFKGVTTVVAKLLNIVGPDTLYLGEKDAQQAAILRRMVKDLDFDVAVKICPTVREPSGLALSSRNRYLSAEQRKQAAQIYKALTAAKRQIAGGERDAQRVIRLARSLIKENTSAKIDYVECVSAQTLEPLKTIKGKALLATAVYFGKTRLIDNITIRAS